VFPSPGTPTASPETTISFRGVKPADLGGISVSGSRSGTHTGQVVAHSDGRGASFVPGAAFTEGETVTVTTPLAVRGGLRGTFAFTIEQPAAGFGVNENPASSTTATPESQLSRFVTRPDLVPPKVAINTNSGTKSGGDVFVTPNPALGQTTSAQSGPMIVDGAGNLVWFDPKPAGTAVDLSVQRYRGKPVLSWFQGVVTTGGTGAGEFVMYDEHYHHIATVHAGNGYDTDLHDFVITPQNTALVLAYNPVLAKASVIHQLHPRVVLDAVVQEIDITTGSVLFEWHSLGNINLDESYLAIPASTTEPYDYVHPNSIAIDTDGNLLLSGRHTSTLYKIDRVTGTLDWRLGGKRGNFDLDTGAKFMWQHDIRPHADDTLSVFDNAASAPGVTSRETSRGLVLHVDEAARKVTTERSDDNPQHALSLSQGDFQLLPNGDWFAGWGSVGEYTEFGPDGNVVLDANIAASSASYRAYRFAWTGTPEQPPAAAAARSGSSIVVAASWNGATQVARWRVLAGRDAGSLQPVATFARSGFETTMWIPAGDARVVKVQALGPAGRVLGTSTATPVK
jgi:arylsulfotransferase ASST